MLNCLSINQNQYTIKDNVFLAFMTFEFVHLSLMQKLFSFALFFIVNLIQHATKPNSLYFFYHIIKNLILYIQYFHEIDNKILNNILECVHEFYLLYF